MAIRRVTYFAAALCVYALAAIDASAGETFEVRIRLRFDQSVMSRQIARFLQEETEAIWAPYGIQLEWTEASGREPARDNLSLDAWIERRFDESQRPEKPPVLGRASLQPDSLNWRPIRVSFDAVKRVVATRAAGEASIGGMVTDRDLARALGRVLAHEIGHVLLDAPYHDRSGLMRPAFRWDELVEHRRIAFRLTCGGVDRLKRRVQMLTEDAPLIPRHDSTATVEAWPGTARQSSRGASCI